MENLMNESPSRWIDNGLPRKGWILDDVIENEFGDYQCEWCATSLRYSHRLWHPENNIHAIAGCICAEHLTQDYVNPRKREKELKKKAKQKKNSINKFFKSFKPGKKSFYSNHFGRNNFILVFQKSDGLFYLKIGDKWGKRSYNDFNAAVLSAYLYMNKQGFV
jgi:hypothetical protein